MLNLYSNQGNAYNSNSVGTYEKSWKIATIHCSLKCKEMGIFLHNQWCRDWHNLLGQDDSNAHALQPCNYTTGILIYVYKNIPTT